MSSFINHDSTQIKINIGWGWGCRAVKGWNLI